MRVRRVVGLAAALLVVAAGCGDPKTRPSPAPSQGPTTSASTTTTVAPTTTTIDPALKAKAQAVVLVARDVPGYREASASGATTSSTRRGTTLTSSGSSTSTTSGSTPTTSADDGPDFSKCKTPALDRADDAPGEVDGPSLVKGVGDNEVTLDSSAVFGASLDKAAMVAELKDEATGTCFGEAIAALFRKDLPTGVDVTTSAAARDLTIPNVDEAVQLTILVTIRGPGGTLAYRFGFVVLFDGDGAATATIGGPGSRLPVADVTAVATVLGRKLARATTAASSTTSSRSGSTASSSRSTTSTTR